MSRRDDIRRDESRRDDGRRDDRVPPARTPGTPAGGVTGPLRLLLSPVTGGLKVARGREAQLRVDWPQCRAHGLCAELAPEVIRLDEWGYPMIDRSAMTEDTMPAVRKAVQACPTLALRIIATP